MRTVFALSALSLLVFAALWGADSDARPEVPPAPDDGVRLAWISDAQHPGERKGLRTAIGTLERLGVEQILYGGDTSYGFGDAPADWLSALASFNDPSRAFFLYGNHDGGPGYARLQPAANGSTYWEARVGPVVVIGLDTNQELCSGMAQMKWLEATLAKHADEVVVLAMHMPWWVPNVYHSPEHSFRGDAAYMDELVTRFGVDLVIAGHEHYYARETRNGVPYIVSGPVDAQLRNVPLDVVASAEHAASASTMILLDLTPGAVHATAVDPNGNALDGVTIGTGPPEDDDPTDPGDDGPIFGFEPAPEPAVATALLRAGAFALGAVGGAALALAPRRLPFLPEMPDALS